MIFVFFKAILSHKIILVLNFFSLKVGFNYKQKYAYSNEKVNFSKLTFFVTIWCTSEAKSTSQVEPPVPQKWYFENVYFQNMRHKRVFLKHIINHGSISNIDGARAEISLI